MFPDADEAVRRLRSAGERGLSTEPMTTRTERLAEAILADRNRPTAERTDIAKCFMCGTGMMYRGSRFCSLRCRDFYDDGVPGHDHDWRRPKLGPMSHWAFRIDCACCSKPFDSKGLRCCSTGCERSYRDRDANLAVMAEVGIEPSAKRSCVECGGRIPRGATAARYRPKSVSVVAEMPDKRHDHGPDAVSSR